MLLIVFQMLVFHCAPIFWDVHWAVECIEKLAVLEKWKSAFSSTLLRGVLVLGFAPLNGSEMKPDEGITDASLSMISF